MPPPRVPSVENEALFQVGYERMSFFSSSLLATSPGSPSSFTGNCWETERNSQGTLGAPGPALPRGGTIGHQGHQGGHLHGISRHGYDHYVSFRSSITWCPPPVPPHGHLQYYQQHPSDSRQIHTCSGHGHMGSSYPFTASALSRSRHGHHAFTAWSL